MIASYKQLQMLERWNSRSPMRELVGDAGVKGETVHWRRRGVGCADG